MGKTIISFIMVADCSKPADFLNPYNLITSLHYIYVRVINWKEKKVAHTRNNPDVRLCI
jgi:hypothetical protein